MPNVVIGERQNLLREDAPLGDGVVCIAESASDEWLPLGIDGECRANCRLRYDVILDSAIKGCHPKALRPSLGPS